MTEDLEIDTHKYLQLIFDKGVNSIKWRKLFQQMELEQLDVHRQRNEPSPKPHSLYNSELKMDHGLKCKT